MKHRQKIIAKTACLCGRAEDGKEGKMHRLLVDDKLQLIAPLHDMKVEKALLKLGGIKPRCLQVVEMWHHAAKMDVTRRTSSNWRRHSRTMTSFILPTKLATFYKELVRVRKAARKANKAQHVDYYKQLADLSISSKTDAWMTPSLDKERFMAPAVDIFMSLANEFKMPETWLNAVTFMSSTYQMYRYYGDAYYINPSAIIRTFLTLGPRAMLFNQYNGEPALILGENATGDSYVILQHTGYTATVDKNTVQGTT